MFRGVADDGGVVSCFMGSALEFRRSATAHSSTVRAVLRTPANHYGLIEKDADTFEHDVVVEG